MTDILKIIVVLIAIIFLMWRKLNIGLVMMAGAGTLALLYRLSPVIIAYTFLKTLSGHITIQLIIALGLIMVMENILRKTKTLKRIMDTLGSMVPDKRLTLAAPPAIIGMVPSIGGAYFSAPLVEEASSTISSLTAEQKGFINYWFRHIWEYVLPTYPGILLASAISGFPLEKLILYQIPFALLVIITGLFFSFRKIKIRRERKPVVNIQIIRRFIIDILPIASVIVLVGILRLDIATTMIIVVTYLFIYHRYSFTRILSTFKESVSIKTLFIIVGVIFFKNILGASGAVQGISSFLKHSGFPLIILYFILPLIAGILTGLTIAFVGITFPLLMTISGNTPEIGHMAFAFASGFTGVMFSPVHLCFVLTGEYFHANRGTIYRYMLVPSFLIMATAIIIWIIG